MSLGGSMKRTFTLLSPKYDVFLGLLDFWEVSLHPFSKFLHILETLNAEEIPADENSPKTEGKKSILFCTYSLWQGSTLKILEKSQAKGIESSIMCVMVF